MARRLVVLRWRPRRPRRRSPPRSATARRPTRTRNGSRERAARLQRESSRPASASARTSRAPASSSSVDGDPRGRRARRRRGSAGRRGPGWSSSSGTRIAGACPRPGRAHRPSPHRLPLGTVSSTRGRFARRSTGPSRRRSTSSRSRATSSAASAASGHSALRSSGFGRGMGRMRFSATTTPRRATLSATRSTSRGSRSRARNSSSTTPRRSRSRAERWVAGADPRRRRQSPPRACCAAEADLRILLIHFPDDVRSLAPGDFHLILAGHLHGGQICIPTPGGKVRLSTCARRTGRGSSSCRSACSTSRAGWARASSPFACSPAGSDAAHAQQPSRLAAGMAYRLEP